MKKLIIPIATTVGYMLKVLKSDIEIDDFNTEFKMIRHGNYFEFINAIKAEVPFTVVYSNGEITADNIAKEDDVDFLGLFNAGPSLREFYIKCYNRYGNIIDPDIPDSIYGRAALFEISLKMHANNRHLIAPREKLVDVINKLCTDQNICQEDVKKLHQGRHFLNMIKHFNNQFSSWEIGIDNLNIAYELLKKHEFTII